jgi:uncharacterized damage-inducible protein DinB
MENEFPGAGVIGGVGLVCRRECLITANEATAKGGATSEIPVSRGAVQGAVQGGRTMNTFLKSFLLLFFLGTQNLLAQAQEGIWQGYDGEWKHASQQLIALAEATPAEKFAWRPAAGVRSTSEVYMHIAIANFYLLSVTGPKMPPDLNQGMEKTVTSKAEVINWLKRSLEAVKTAHAAATPKDLERKVHIADRDATVDGMYLRIIVHANEHMGQLIAYARMTGMVPPWSNQ